MQIVFYSPTGDEAGDHLQEILVRLFSPGVVETHRQINALIQRLRVPNAGLEMLVFMPASRTELFAAASFLEDLNDIRLILVLPDRENETIAMAHRLRPRFLTYANADFSELKEVLKKMLKSSGTTSTSVS